MSRAEQANRAQEVEFRPVVEPGSKPRYWRLRALARSTALRWTVLALIAGGTNMALNRSHSQTETPAPAHAAAVTPLLDEFSVAEEVRALPSPANVAQAAPVKVAETAVKDAAAALPQAVAAPTPIPTPAPAAPVKPAAPESAQAVSQEAVKPAVAAPVVAAKPEPQTPPSGQAPAPVAATAKSADAKPVETKTTETKTTETKPVETSAPKAASGAPAAPIQDVGTLAMPAPEEPSEPIPAKLAVEPEKPAAAPAPKRDGKPRCFANCPRGASSEAPLEAGLLKPAVMTIPAATEPARAPVAASGAKPGPAQVVCFAGCYATTRTVRYEPPMTPPPREWVYQPMRSASAGRRGYY